ncbi:MAG: hypothetical protein LQ342_001036 [Letrouitia transgressa]|nr:MAG: hypothetical protein LQ342_001036 [Letrouitia transgressa]
MAMFDDILADLCSPNTLRIPPLHDPFPFPTIVDTRPLPLEPKARLNTNIDSETAKLTGRRKALAEAKPIGDPENADLQTHTASRKRHKLYGTGSISDFVQLPKPKTKTEDDQPRPFQPISVLNQLHEPPPSAALFPPITPNTTIADQARGSSTGSESENGGREISTAEKPEIEKRSHGAHLKRLYLRPRTKWSAAETDDLLKGTEIYGVGKWKEILNHPEFSFLEGRTPVDLKDRSVVVFLPCRTSLTSHPSFRTLKGRQVHRPYVNRPETASGSMLERSSSTPTDLALRRSKPTFSSTKGHAPKKRHPKQHWTKEEDASLIKGYQQHGFAWTRIAKNPSFKLQNKTGPQIRDRFRLKFPELYGEASGSRKDPRRRGGPTRKPCFGLSPGGALSDGLEEDPDMVEEESTSSEVEGPNKKAASSQSKQMLSASVVNGISDLLNTDEDIHHPSFRDSEWDQNVTLPPLLWEDMCAKPIFDLD